MIPILTVTTNPSLDLATSVPRVIAGKKLRCRAPRYDPGGGGVNVARAIARLGGATTALMAASGASGEAMLAMLAKEGVPTLAIPLREAMRQSFAVTDESDGAQYRFSLPGAAFDAAACRAFLDAAVGAAAPGGCVVLSGSVAPGLDPAFPSALAEALAPSTDRLIVDTSGPALARLVTAPGRPLRVLRFDRAEAAAAAGVPLETVADLSAFAGALVRRGVAQIVISGLGAAGSVMATADGVLVCACPPQVARSAIGAGDAFVGALAWRLALGDAASDALRWGVGAAGATMETEGTELFDTDAVRRLAAECTLRDAGPGV